MSTGSIEGYNNDELDFSGEGEIEVGGVSPEIVAELRESLGAIPEVVAYYGAAADTPYLTTAYNNEEPHLYNNVDDMLSRSGSGGVEEDEVEDQEDEQERGGGTDEEMEAIFGPSNADPQSAVPAQQPEGYIDSLSEIRGAAHRGGEDARGQAPVAPAQSAKSKYEAKRKELDLRMAKMAQFLPEKTRLKLDGAFSAAVKKSRDGTDEAYEAATEGLGRVAEALDKFAPTLRSAECEHLRKQIGTKLARDGDVLTPDDRKWYEEEFSKLDVDTPAAEEDAKQHLADLQLLAGNLSGAIEARLKAISDLAVDYERLTPILKRALAIEHDKHAELEKAVNDLNAGFAGDYVKQGLSIEAIDGELKGVESLAREIFQDFTLDDALKEQKASLPADPDSLKPKGAAFASGNFGEVFHLDNDAGQPLVGKLPKATNAGAKEEMKHEAEIYARIGEHPNITRCYGMQEVETAQGKQEMLVMDEIEGQDIEKVFDKLDKRYRKGKLNREEYLAGLQHIMKGTLMGIAHMESLGLVHKDIKGDNIKFDPKTNQPMLIDMGLAQSEGAHEKPVSWVLIEPPENRAGRTDGPAKRDDKVVTNVWDSFTAGKLLFEEMEREQIQSVEDEEYRYGDRDRHVLTPGADPIAKKDVMTQANVNYFAGEGPKKVLGRNAQGELEAKTDASGELVGQALKKGETAEQAGKAGYHGAETSYVDFMNRLTHPDPSLRMTASEALKHPFMAQALSEGRDMDSIFNPKKKKPAEDSPEEGVAANFAAAEVIYTDQEGNLIDPDDHDPDNGPMQVIYKDQEGNIIEQREFDASSEEAVSFFDLEHPDPYQNDADKEDSPPAVVYKDQEGNVIDPDQDDSSEGGAAALFDKDHPNPYDNDQLDLEESQDDSEDSSSYDDSEEDDKDSGGGYQNVDLDLQERVEESEGESAAPVAVAPPAAQSREEVKQAMAGGASPLKLWQAAEQQIEQQFNAAYGMLKDDKAALKAAGFTKGNKFSKYFTYNKNLDKLIDKLEKSHAKGAKTVAKDKAAVLEATKHYHDKIVRKATEDFGWVNADPPIKTPFWKTMIVALNDVDQWAKGLS